MARAAEYLIEIGAYGTALETLRVSSCGYVTGASDTPPNTRYEKRVINPGYFDRSIFSPGKTQGQAEASVGDIVIENVNGDLDGWLDKGFSARTVVVKSIAHPSDAFATAKTMIRGTIEGIHSNSAMSQLTLRLYDRRLELDKPIQANRYGGTTTSGGQAGSLADGTADMKDRVKPLNYGTTTLVTPAAVNPFDLIYQVHDGSVVSIVVYDGGVALSNRGDYPTVALLQAAVLKPGGYATCLAAGLFRLGGTPWSAVTADVVEGTALSNRCAGSVAMRMLSKMGITGSANVDMASFLALNAAAPQEVGIYIAEEMNCLDAISKVLDSVGGYIVAGSTGTFTMGRLALGTPIWDIGYSKIMGEEIELASNTDTAEGLPIYRLVLRYLRNFTPQTRVGQYLSADRQTFLKTEYREIKADATAVQTKHLLAPEMTIDTLLVSAVDAAAEATRRLALYSVRRDTVTLSIRRDDADAMVLGSTGLLTYPRHGYASGKPMLVIGRRDDPASELVQLTLWG